MNLLEVIKNIDTSLLLTINGWHSTYFDQFMFSFSSKFVWIAFYAAVLAYLLFKSKKNALPVIVAIILCIVLCDQISSTLIKDTVQRLRPTQNSDLLSQLHIINGYKGGKYGFVSSHAANTFGFALLTSCLFKNRIYTSVVFLWAAVTAYSRVYIGVHYPLDVVGGMIVGLCVSIFILWLLKKYFPVTHSEFKLDKKSIFPDYLPSAAMIFSIVGILICSIF
jgi:undecaprenyl-diphosphatase